MSSTQYSHTSSIDFCERNYLWTPHIVEFHNTWSSLIIALLPLIGAISSNPTGEGRFKAMYYVMIAVGCGSVMLHATLHHLSQSLDEVPMLWMNLTFLYALIEGDSALGKPRIRHLGPLFVIVGVIKTWFYFTFQSFYAVFLFTYISVVVVVVFWTRQLAFHSLSSPISSKLWIASIISYVGIGGPLWIIEMAFCDLLIGYFDQAWGLTLHIVWHFGAALGTYLLILFFVSLRLQRFGLKPKLGWTCFGIVPIVMTDDQKSR